MLRKHLRNRVALPAVACHLAVLSVQYKFIAHDTDSWTTTKQRSSKTIRSAECEQLGLFVMTSESSYSFEVNPHVLYWKIVSLWSVQIH